jgi:ribosome biogenesis GTPase / thiamine phosphate phosphatase
MITTQQLGWSDYFEQKSHAYREQGFSFGRISNEQRGHYYLLTGRGEFRAEPSGKVLFTASSQAELPKVGDWVAFTPFNDNEGIVHAVLPRKSVISRKDPSGDEEQVLLANIDILFIMQGLDNDFNPRRMERYIVMARSGGASPVVLLNKSDLVESTEPYLEALSSLLDRSDIITLSALEDAAVESVAKILQSGVSAAMVGSSGVGKSTLLNRLLGNEVQRTTAVREDDSRGRHTTTSRFLYVLDQGGVIIDTPGMRELAPWADNETLSSSFDDIAELAEECRYSDCSHTVEQGCAILAAVEDGSLDEKRFKGFSKLQRELEYLNNTESYLERKDRVMKAQKLSYQKFFKGRKE